MGYLPLFNSLKDVDSSGFGDFKRMEWLSGQYVVVNPPQNYPVADIAARDALSGVRGGDIADIVDADGSGNRGISFFDGVSQSWSTPIITGVSINIYSSSSTISGPRTVTYAANTLDFDGTADLSLGDISGSGNSSVLLLSDATSKFNFSASSSYSPLFEFSESLPATSSPGWQVGMSEGNERFRLLVNAPNLGGIDYSINVTDVTTAFLVGNYVEVGVDKYENRVQWDQSATDLRQSFRRVEQVGIRDEVYRSNSGTITRIYTELQGGFNPQLWRLVSDDSVASSFKWIEVDAVDTTLNGIKFYDKFFIPNATPLVTNGINSVMIWTGNGSTVTPSFADITSLITVSDTNIYNTSSNISSDREVTLNGFDLTFILGNQGNNSNPIEFKTADDLNSFNFEPSLLEIKGYSDLTTTPATLSVVGLDDSRHPIVKITRGQASPTFTPEPLFSGNVLGEIGFFGVDQNGSFPASNVPFASIRAIASQAYTTSKHGTSLAFMTTSNNSNVIEEVGRIKQDGRWQFNNYGSGNFPGTVAFLISVDSSGNLIEAPISDIPTIYSSSATIGENRKVTFGSDNLNFEGVGLFTIGDSEENGFGSIIQLDDTNSEFKLEVKSSTLLGTLIIRNNEQINNVSINSVKNFTSSINTSGFIGQVSRDAAYISGIKYNSESARGIVELWVDDNPSSRLKTLVLGDGIDTNYYANSPITEGLLIYSSNDSTPFFVIDMSTPTGRASIYNQLLLPSYGSNNYTGTVAYFLAVDASGNVIETSLPAAQTTIYSGDSTVSGTRKVTYGSNSLTFEGTTSLFVGDTEDNGFGSFFEFSDSLGRFNIGLSSSSRNSSYNFGDDQLTKNIQLSGSKFYSLQINNSYSSRIYNTSFNIGSDANANGVTSGWIDLWADSATPTRKKRLVIGENVNSSFFANSTITDGILIFEEQNNTLYMAIDMANNDGSVSIYNQFLLPSYGSGSYTGTATRLLAVDTNGNVIEEDIATYTNPTVDTIYTANSTVQGPRIVTLADSATLSFIGDSLISFADKNNTSDNLFSFDPNPSSSVGFTVKYDDSTNFHNQLKFTGASSGLLVNIENIVDSWNTGRLILSDSSLILSHGEGQNGSYGIVRSNQPNTPGDIILEVGYQKNGDANGEGYMWSFGPDVVNDSAGGNGLTGTNISGEGAIFWGDLVGSVGREPLIEIGSDNGSNPNRIWLHNQLNLVDYGSGTYTGTAVSILAIDSGGNLIEENLGVVTNIYTANGTLSGDRVVNLGVGNSLHWEGGDLVAWGDYDGNFEGTIWFDTPESGTSAFSGYFFNSGNNNEGQFNFSASQTSLEFELGGQTYSASSQLIMNPSNVKWTAYGSGNKVGAIEFLFDQTGAASFNDVKHFVNLSIGLNSTTGGKKIRSGLISDGLATVLNNHTTANNNFSGTIDNITTGPAFVVFSTQTLPSVENKAYFEIDMSIPTGKVYSHNQLSLVDYGSGSYSGTNTFLLGVDASGNVIEVNSTGVDTNIYNTDGTTDEDSVRTITLGDPTNNATSLILNAGNLTLAPNDSYVKTILSNVTTGIIESSIYTTNSGADTVFSETRSASGFFSFHNINIVSPGLSSAMNSISTGVVKLEVTDLVSNDKSLVELNKDLLNLSYVPALAANGIGGSIKTNLSGITLTEGITGVSFTPLVNLSESQVLVKGSDNSGSNLFGQLLIEPNQLTIEFGNSNTNIGMESIYTTSSVVFRESAVNTTSLTIDSGTGILTWQKEALNNYIKVRSAGSNPIGGGILVDVVGGTFASPGTVTVGSGLGIIAAGENGAFGGWMHVIKGSGATNEVRFGNGANPTSDIAMRILESSQIKLDSYGVGTHTGVANRYLAVDSSGNVIEELVPNESVVGNVRGFATANTASHSILNSHEVTLIDASGTSITLTLPPPANSTNKKFTLKVIDATNSITVNVSGGANIDSSPSYTRLDSIVESVTVVSNGTQYYII